MHFPEFYKCLQICLFVVKFYIVGVYAILIQMFRRHKMPKNLLPGDGMVAIVTGGCGGIGLHTCKKLAGRGVHIIVAARTEEDAIYAISFILKDFPNAKLEYMHLELMSLTSIRTFASDFSKKNLPLNILINNAGTMLTPYGLTEDGFEQQFGVNYLGHFLLTHLLLDNLKASGTPDRCSRIINVSSVEHFAGSVNMDDLNASHCYCSHFAYSQSKTAQVLHAYRLQRELASEGAAVTANALHPGVVATRLYDHCNAPLRALLSLLATVKVLFKTPDQGADTTLYSALSADLENVGGRYLDNCQCKQSSAATYDRTCQDRLWDISCHLVGLADS